MELSRKLSEGVGSWLQYQYACNNSDLFCEQFLIEPIGRILSSTTTDRVIAEYQHPVFAPMKTGPGRRPSVDFVVCEPYPTVRYAVETKWIGKTKPSVQSILWDLIRLEQIAHADGATCFFILGGQKRSLDAYFASEVFRGPKGLHPGKPLLNYKKNYKFELDLSGSVIHRREMVKNVLAPFQDHPFPLRIHARRTNPFPEGCKAGQFQIYVWEITAKPKRDVFYPKNSKHYAV
ncbi:MAG: hypothetical protein KBT77_16685 [Thalassolituus oleivorans]|uniref:hypothetical protein n=1 Tax=Thalassolituus oleivorans TaxID=187493 RepID=UPI001B5EBF9F|nr:hypothetical protein [Thalassolituus oleivorans]MBQ0728984.1 hypothetical protein [Thalassolituus oleivorans]